jgi:hypothetical protein
MINSLTRILRGSLYTGKAAQWSLVLSELQLRAGGVWKAMRPEGNVRMRKQKKELRALADRISTYGSNVHQRYPTGDVVVSERDLAALFRKRPDAVATALTLLLGEQKVQRAALNGYWKLNV